MALDSDSKIPLIVSVDGCNKPGEYNVQPRFLSDAPHTTILIWAQYKAAAHIGQGSMLTYKVQFVKYFELKYAHAEVIAIISAWAVASFKSSVWLWVLVIIFSSQTMTAPTGTSPLENAISAIKSAFFIKKPWSGAEIILK